MCSVSSPTQHTFADIDLLPVSQIIIIAFFSVPTLSSSPLPSPHLTFSFLMSNLSSPPPPPPPSPHITTSSSVPTLSSSPPLPSYHHLILRAFSHSISPLPSPFSSLHHACLRGLACMGWGGEGQRGGEGAALKTKMLCLNPGGTRSVLPANTCNASWVVQTCGATCLTVWAVKTACCHA